MRIKIHPHASERMKERGVTAKEALDTIKTGEKFQAKFGRIGFRKDFIFSGTWQDKEYGTKQVEVYAVWEKAGLIVITVIARYF